MNLEPPARNPEPQVALLRQDICGLQDRPAGNGECQMAVERGSFSRGRTLKACAFVSSLPCERGCPLQSLSLDKPHRFNYFLRGVGGQAMTN